MSSEERAARAIVKRRAHGTCEVAIPSVCRGVHETTHHRKKRRHDGGGWRASNLLAVCGDGTRGCHGWIEAHPEASVEYGWWVKSHNDPAATPVYIQWHGGRSWWVIDDEGILHFQAESPDTIVEDL